MAAFLRISLKYYEIWRFPGVFLCFRCPMSERNSPPFSYFVFQCSIIISSSHSVTLPSPAFFTLSSPLCSLPCRWASRRFTYRIIPQTFCHLLYFLTYQVSYPTCGWLLLLLLSDDGCKFVHRHLSIPNWYCIIFPPLCGCVLPAYVLWVLFSVLFFDIYSLISKQCSFRN